MVTESDIGRVFLQSIISRRVVSEKLVRILFKKSIEAVKAFHEDARIDENNYEHQIHRLNKLLEPIDFKIVSTLDEVTGTKIWVFINTKSDELSQLASDFSPSEIAYFRIVVEQIVLASSGSYSVSSMTALREVNSLKPTITKSHAQNLLDTFVAKGWLLKSRRGRYSLSSRTLLELHTYLKFNYENDIHECTICFELLTKGVGCYTRQCDARLHSHCFKRFARDSRVSCPSCQVDWSDKSKLQKIGEGSLRDGQDSVTRHPEEDDSDYQEEDEGVEEQLTATEIEPEPKLPTNGKSKSKSKGEKPLENDASDDSMPKRSSRRRR